MHSARTEPATGRFATVRGWFQRLNVRLVIALASTAAVALLVSGVALSQILPGYFLDQAARSSQTAALSTALLLDERVQRVLQQTPQWMATPELRKTQVFQPVAQLAADELAQATVQIFNPDGSLAASAVPSAERMPSFVRQGLQPDPQVPVKSARSAPIPIPNQPAMRGRRSPSRSRTRTGSPPCSASAAPWSAPAWRRWPWR